MYVWLCADGVFIRAVTQPSSKRGKTVDIRSASLNIRTNTVFNRCVTLIIRSATVVFYECVRVLRYKSWHSLVSPPWIVMDSYLNRRKPIYNHRKTLLVPLSIVLPVKTGFTTIHHDSIIHDESWSIGVRTVTVWLSLSHTVTVLTTIHSDSSRMI